MRKLKISLEYHLASGRRPSLATKAPVLPFCNDCIAGCKLDSRRNNEIGSSEAHQRNQDIHAKREPMSEWQRFDTHLHDRWQRRLPFCLEQSTIGYRTHARHRERKFILGNARGEVAVYNFKHGAKMKDLDTQAGPIAGLVYCAREKAVLVACQVRAGHSVYDRIARAERARIDKRRHIHTCQDLCNALRRKSAFHVSRYTIIQGTHGQSQNQGGYTCECIHFATRGYESMPHDKYSASASGARLPQKATCSY